MSEEREESMSLPIACTLTPVELAAMTRCPQGPTRSELDLLSRLS